jgi:hypothetical protein
MGPGSKPKYICTDGSQDFEKAAKDLGWLHDESNPYRPETNGVAERAVRRVKEGTAATLVQSGFDESWWDEAMVCFCFLRNVVDLHTISANKKNLGTASRKGSDDNTLSTSYKLRFNEDFRGPIYPFGALVDYKPSSDKDKSRVHKFGKSTLEGIFLGYHQHAGGGWSGDLLVADVDALEGADDTSDIYTKRIKAEEVIPIQGKGGKGTFVLPLVDGKVKQPGPGQKRVIHRGDVADIPDLVDSESEVGDEEAPSESLPSNEQDFWSLNKYALTRHHPMEG